MTHGDEELQLYTAEQVSLRDGMLVLTTAKKTAMHGTKEYVMLTPPPPNPPSTLLFILFFDSRTLMVALCHTNTSQSHVLYCPIYADVRAIY